jgi:hypothetical protein
MTQAKLSAAIAGAVLAGVSINASACSMVQAVEGSVADKSMEQMLKSASKLTTTDLVRQYGVPVALKSMAGGRQQMNWALADGEFRVLADAASGKVLDVKMVAAKQSSASVVLAARCP